jgi:hypothetical protein
MSVLCHMLRIVKIHLLFLINHNISFRIYYKYILKITI